MYRWIRSLSGGYAPGCPIYRPLRQSVWEGPLLSLPLPQMYVM
jgi:hypothetical protein